MSRRFEGKVAIVSGAGTVAPGWSNGNATSVLFAREGARVFAIDRDAAAAEETRRLIAGESGECRTHTADVSVAREVEAAVAACIAVFGRIDILFNNVGVQAVGGPESVDETTWDRLMTVNVKSMYLMCRAVLPVMRHQGGGAIVNNSSLAALRFTYPSVAYSASKGAVNELTTNIAIEYARFGIRVNAVLPGLMATPRITKRLKASHGERFAEELAKRDALVPLGRMGDALDVAHAVLFLASDEAKYITGVKLPVDGGISCSALGRPWSDQ
jgi:NAD(P)-dependent dehydrogenase (short-subunit alcohol dehydrogenase family)